MSTSVRCTSPLNSLLTILAVFWIIWPLITLECFRCHCRPGILPNGSSSLLLPSYKLQSARATKQARDFLSISPIHFASVEELKEKMKWLEPRKGPSKAKKAKDMDTSKANSGYYITIVGEAESRRGWQRAAFEHSRCVIYS